MIDIDSIPTYDKTGVVYSIRNIATGREYIGGTRKYRNRILGHLTNLRNGKHHSKKMQFDFDAFGENDFEVQVLEFVTSEGRCTRRHLLKRETEYLQTIRPYYNNLLIAY